MSTDSPATPRNTTLDEEHVDPVGQPMQDIDEGDLVPEPGFAPPEPAPEMEQPVTEDVAAQFDELETPDIHQRLDDMERDFRAEANVGGIDGFSGLSMDSQDPVQRAEQSDRAVARLLQQLQGVTAERDQMASELGALRGEVGKLRALVTQTMGRQQALGDSRSTRDPLGNRDVYDRLRALHGYEAPSGVMEKMKSFAAEHKLAVGTLLIMIMGLGIPVIGSLAVAGGIAASQHFVARLRSNYSSRKKLTKALAKAKVVAAQVEKATKGLGASSDPEQAAEREAALDQLRRDMAQALDGVAQAKGEIEHMDDLGWLSRIRLSRDQIRAGKSLRKRNITEKSAARIARSIDSVQMHQRSGEVLGAEWLEKVTFLPDDMAEMTTDHITKLEDVAFNRPSREQEQDAPGYSAGLDRDS